MNFSTAVQSDKILIAGIVAYSNVSSFIKYNPRIRNYATLNPHF